MCGVVGFFAGPGQTLGPEALAGFLDVLGESRVRGKHAAGAAWLANDGSLSLVRSHDYGETVKAVRGLPPHATRWLIGHTRYSTSGDWRDPANNQPVAAAGMALALNGVIDAGTKPEFEARWAVRCDADNDAEIFLRRVEQGEAPAAFARRIKGSLAACWIDARDPSAPKAYALRNPRRPLWAVTRTGYAAFASTRDIFRRAGFPDAEELPANTLWQTD